MVVFLQFKFLILFADYTILVKYKNTSTTITVFVRARAGACLRKKDRQVDRQTDK